MTSDDSSLNSTLGSSIVRPGITWPGKSSGLRERRPMLTFATPCDCSTATAGSVRAYKANECFVWAPAVADTVPCMPPPAQVTVVDVSSAQLELDRIVAQERRLTLQTVETSMDDLSMFGSEQFEIVVHPVSSCYLPDLRPVYAEVARVTVAGGLYVSQHKQPTSLQMDVRPVQAGYVVTEPYYRQGPLPAIAGSLHREEGTL